jgi:anti-anti-sigma factor
MNVKATAREGDVIHLACEGSVTPYALVDEDPLEALLSPEDWKRTAFLDLSKTDFMDSSGISWLIVAHKRFLRSGGRLVLHSFPERIQHIVELVRLPLILNVAPDEAGALALLGGAAR